MQQPTFATKHPYRFTALLMAAIVLVYLASGTAAALLKLPASNTSNVFLLANLALAILGAALLTGLRWWRVVGFRAPAEPRDLLLYWLPCALVLVNLASGVALGFGFAAVTLRTGILWPLVLIHALIDFASFLVSDGASAGSPTTTDMAFTALTIVAFMGYGIVMMRAGKPLSRAGARPLALAEAAS